jgi:hypothetical protein
MISQDSEICEYCGKTIIKKRYRYSKMHDHHVVPRQLTFPSETPEKVRLCQESHQLLHRIIEREALKIASKDPRFFHRCIDQIKILNRCGMGEFYLDRMIQEQFYEGTTVSPLTNESREAIEK